MSKFLKLSYNSLVIGASGRSHHPKLSIFRYTWSLLNFLPNLKLKFVVFFRSELCERDYHELLIAFKRDFSEIDLVNNISSVTWRVHYSGSLGLIPQFSNMTVRP
jgi:hypothetical protein